MHCIDKTYINKSQAVVDYKDVNFDQKLNAKAFINDKVSAIADAFRFPSYVALAA